MKVISMILFFYRQSKHNILLSEYIMIKVIIKEGGRVFDHAIHTDTGKIFKRFIFCLRCKRFLNSMTR